MWASLCLSHIDKNNVNEPPVWLIGRLATLLQISPDMIPCDGDLGARFLPSALAFQKNKKKKT